MGTTGFRIPPPPSTIIYGVSLSEPHIDEKDVRESYYTHTHNAHTQYIVRIPKYYINAQYRQHDIMFASLVPRCLGGEAKEKNAWYSRFHLRSNIACLRVSMCG